MSNGTSVSTLVGSNIPARNHVSDAQEFRLVKVLGGGAAPVQEFDEDTGESFKAGQCVYRTAGGYLAEATDGIAAIVGVALIDATGVQGSKIPVWLGQPGVIFEATATTPSNLAQNLKGDLVDLDVTTGVHTVDENDSTDDVFSIVDFPTGATDSTHPNYGKVWVQVVSYQLGQNSEDAI